jgi:hypothetical protein
MIQTWVTYEVVKVIFLYGLNPEPNTTIKEVAPQLQTYIQYIKDPNESTYETAETVHKSLFNKTLHSSYFLRCKFADVDKVLWKDEVKFTIPFIILSWLRQLQQGFNEPTNTISWSTLGNYTPIDIIPRGDAKDQLALVYLSKPNIPPEPPVKVKSYTDIKPDETYEATETNYTIKSLELWAMMLLQTPVEKKLNDTAKVDKETRMRQESCGKLNRSNYRFMITPTNFASSNTRTQKRNKTEHEFQPITNTTNESDDRLQAIGTGQLQPAHNNTNTNISEHRDNLDYANNTTHELHSTISNGLSEMEQQLTNLNQETDPTTNSTNLATLLKSIQQAYIALANITFQGETEGNTLDSLDTIKRHLLSKLTPNESKAGSKNSEVE